MNDKEKYEKLQADCQKYIDDIRGYCRQTRLNYDTPNVILRKTSGSSTKSKAASGPNVEKDGVSKAFAQSHYSRYHESARNLNDDDDYSRESLTKTSNNQTTYKPKSARRPTHDELCSDEYTSKNEPKIGFKHLPINKKRIKKPSVSTSPVFHDVQFKGKFGTVSECEITSLKCCRCNKEYEGIFEVVACPDCKHWMHIECFVDHVYEQRGKHKRLSCPKCQNKYF